MKFFGSMSILCGVVLLITTPVLSQTKAIDSVYEQDIRKALTSYNLTNADLAWHALNTYGWNCAEVVSRSASYGAYYIINCASGKHLRVYSRPNAHPRITNSKGKYD